MDAKIIVALVVIIAVAAHVVLYRWVKFKIQEGVILQWRVLRRCVRRASRFSPIRRLRIAGVAYRYSFAA